MEDFDIRYTEMEDEPLVSSWFSAEEDRFHYPITEKKEVAPFVKNLVGFCKFKASLTAIVEKTPVGIATLFLMPYRKLAHNAMFYIIVDPKYRKKGIGSSLVRNILHLGKTRFSLHSVHCEIFEGSFLLPILKEQGFFSFAVQERYVKWNGQYYHRNLLEHFFA